ncbi:BTB/POZ domain-containing adapter for CUL3-mediated RhoA degradation protein 2 isoform X1 [Panthera uncia]|uniref:BTB/POZ domain-containing adapter for CUL3-mediated RhoA degradation protein 2 isoform X1 n=1 Tax=Panthera uncia TaxID=29064 RepID=UPI0020FFDF0B|nr:BTB/POZ domain-containing adapter for CUL3-mediated RhoA degradation protein 2 isoform X1 [Panthera uncia]
MSGDTCLCPASGAKPKLGGFKGGGLGNKYVQLNVGGSLYYTTVRALTRHDTMLKAMFSGRMEVLTDKEGWILIDRCGKHFGTILNYLRDDTIILPQNRQEIKELMAEAKYYLIQGLVNMCQTALQDKKDSYQPVCNIPIITSLKEEERLIESSTKPVVKLLYNRSNNKYSYTSNSDDHLLKNIELFDKLSLRFNGRVLFLKDVIGDEICCWSFYGQGRKLAEVCCTSIVYATEKKQTKVWRASLCVGGTGHSSAAPAVPFTTGSKKGVRFALSPPNPRDGAGQFQEFGERLGSAFLGQLRGRGRRPARDSVVQGEGLGLWSWPSSGLNSGSAIY